MIYNNSLPTDGTSTLHVRTKSLNRIISNILFSCSTREHWPRPLTDKLL